MNNNISFTRYVLSLLFGLWWGLTGCVSATDHFRQTDPAVPYRFSTGDPHPVQPESSSAADLSESPLSLENAIERALTHNPDRKMAIARIRRARAEARKAKAFFYPSLGVYTEFIQGDSPSAYLFKKIDQRELPPQTDFNDPGEFENFESGATVRFNLYNGGKDFLGARIAETGEQISRLDLLSVENSLIASVIETFYDALAAESYISIAEQSVKTVQSQLRIMEVRYRAGGALKSDILSLRVRLADARQEAVAARNRYLKTMAALANLLGIDPEPPLSLREAEPEPPRLPESYPGGVAMALQLRPELRKVRHRVEQSRMNIDRVRGDYHPRLNFEGRYYLDDEDFSYDMNRENWTVGLMLEWDIFTGFSTRARELEAEAALEEILSADNKTGLSVKLDVRNAYLNAESASARYEAARAGVEAAEESLRLVKKQYEGGSATITRYLGAELDRNRARTRESAAFHDRQKALADIARAVGYWTEYLGEPANLPIKPSPSEPGAENEK